MCQRFAPQLVEQQPSAGLGVVRLGFDQGPGRENGCERQFVDGDAVIEIAMGLRDDGSGGHAVQPVAGFRDHRIETRGVEPRFGAIGRGHMHRARGRRLRHVLRCRPGAFPRPLLAIQHIGARDLVMFAAHQGQFDLILDVFDMEGTAGIGAPRQV